MKILCIGDIVGRYGRFAVKALIPKMKEEFSLDLVIANAENASGGSGLTKPVAVDLFNYGCNVLTLGDHVWDRRETADLLAATQKIIRPANFPEGTPGRGWCIVQTSSGQKIGVINLLGRVFMRYNINCPFHEVKRLIEEIKKQTPIIIVDIHAETTSEKIALGFFLAGEVSAVVGTHTHVQTADEKILPKGTAYITDLGMTGPYDSVIGQNKEKIIKRFLSSMPTKFEVATDNIQLHGVVIDIDSVTGIAREITRVQKTYN